MYNIILVGDNIVMLLKIYK